MVDIPVMRDNFSLNCWSTNSLRRGRRRRRLRNRRGRRSPLTLNDTSADALPLFNWRGRRGRRRLLWSLNVSHNSRGRRSSPSRWWLRGLPDSLSLVYPGTRVLVLMVVRVSVRVMTALRGDTAGSSNDAFLSDTDWAGTSRSVSVDGLYLTLAQDHGTSFGSANVISQKCGCARLLSRGRADCDGAATIIDFIEPFWSGTSRSRVVIPFLEIGSPYTGHFWCNKVLFSVDMYWLWCDVGSANSIKQAAASRQRAQDKAT
jgi:hypothetical protein